MARIRTVKPEHWADKGLTSISLQAHLLWIGTWNFSDDKGVFENDPILIKSQIFPRRTDVRIEQVISWLDQLEKARYIVPFDYKNQGYYINRTFGTHQRIDKPQGSKIPKDFLISILERYANDTVTLPPVLYGNVGEGKGNVFTKENFEKSCVELMGSAVWIEKIAMENKKTVPFIVDKLEKFLKMLELQEDFQPTGELKKYFVRYLSKQMGVESPQSQKVIVKTAAPKA